MNLPNKFKAAFVYLIIVYYATMPQSCSGQAAESTRVQQIDSGLNLIDTLRINIDTKGHSALIKIFDAGIEQNRIVEIELRNGSQVKQILQNDQLIYCGTCGRQSSDPYFNLRTNKIMNQAFDIVLDGIVNTFLVESTNVYLQKIDVLHVTPGDDRYLEWHEIYTPEDFGKLPFEEVTEELIFRLRDSTTLEKLKHFYN